MATKLLLVGPLKLAYTLAAANAAAMSAPVADDLWNSAYVFAA